MKIFKLIKDKYINTTLSNKIIIAMSIAFIILFSFIVSFNQMQTIKTITRQQSTLSAEILKMKCQDFTTYYNQLEHYSLMLRNDSYFMQLLSLSDIQDYSDYIYIQNSFKNMFYSRKDISELTLYLVNQGFGYSISKKYPNIRILINPDFTKLKEFSKASMGPSYKYIAPSNDNPNNFLKIYRAIIDIQNQKPLAYVEITVDNSYIKNLANSNSSNDDIFCLLDKYNNLYYTNNADVIKNNTLSQLVPAKIDTTDEQSYPISGSFISSINDTKYLFIYTIDNNTNWLFLKITPTSIVNKSVVKTRNITILISIIALIIAMFAIFMLTRTLLRPLKTLASQMDKAGGGDFGATIDVKGSAEIKHLEARFNSMLLRINELIEKNYISELNEKTAKLKALEAQINPHFLYNTLQMISTQAIINNQKDISNMVLTLSSMLRYSITDNDIVPLAAEIKHVKDYLTLQKARFDERLSYNINVENNIGDLLLPKISIMSLVENSIKHGMETTLDKIQVDIYVKLRQGYLIVIVNDSGAGMSKEKLEYVKKQISLEGDRGQSIGLSNLASRLKILYDNLASIEIESSKDKGTSVEMRIPVNVNIRL